MKVKPIFFRFSILCVIIWPQLFQAGHLYAAVRAQPSVVLVIMDSVRADRVSPYGYAGSSTSALENFAGKAVVFENAYANSGWTGASFATILTGKRPFAHSVIGLSDALPQNIPTIPEILSANGYETAAFLSGLPRNEQYGLNRGFAKVVKEEKDAPMLKQVEKALEWQRSLPPEKDFFMMIHGNDAHYPYVFSKKTPLRDEWTTREGRNFFLCYSNAFIDWNMRTIDPDKCRKALSYKGNAKFLAEISGAYDSCVSNLDKAIAVLDAGLKSLDRPLLVIVTADHGEFLGEYGLIGHGYMLRKQLVKIPLLISFPGQKSVRRTGVIAEHADLLPTICGAVGIACPDGLDGKDLLVKANSVPEPTSKWAAAGGITDNYLKSVVRLAAFSDNNKKLVLARSRWRLFDSDSDPAEVRDFSRQRPEEFMATASSYLDFSGFKNVFTKPRPTGTSVQDCAIYPPLDPPDIPAGASACDSARTEAEYLAAKGDLSGAALRLANSKCPAKTVVKYQKALKLLNEAYSAGNIPERKGYVFSVEKNMWRMTKDGFSVSYAPDQGLKCETLAGAPAADPACSDLSEALLNCAERYRFKGGREDKREQKLEDALRQAGYLH